MEMPPLELMVLDSLADDEETVETMRDHGEVAPYGLALVSEADVIAAIGAGLDDGLIEALEEQPGARGLVWLSAPRHDPSSLRRDWFRPTEQGWRVWRDGWELLDAYYEAHPV